MGVQALYAVLMSSLSERLLQVVPTVECRCWLEILAFSHDDPAQVENPIPFAPLQSTRVMSTAYLHALYCKLLLLPYNLSCDWSYACVPLVELLTGAFPTAAGCTARFTHILLLCIIVRALWPRYTPGD